MMARPPSSGWASGASGWMRSRPRRANGSVWKKGEPAASGWIAEKTSWRKPGSVSASVRDPPPMDAAPSTTRTDLPARASVMAAASPLGPAPTKTAPTGPPPCPPPEGEGIIRELSGKVDDGALSGRLDLEGPAAMAGDDRIDLVVGPCRIGMKEQESLGSRLLRQTDRVLDRGVPIGGTFRELGPRDLTVVDQQVGGPREGDGGGMIRAESLGPLSKRDRAMVR